MPDGRVTIAMITHNRREEARHALDRIAELPERPPVVVVDNGSGDGTAAMVRREHPGVRLVEAGANLGAIGRNLAVAHVTTPYVAFCDDDTWWEPGAPAAAADLLDAHPRLAGVTGRIVVEPGGTEDPVVAEMRDSPVPPPDWLPGPALMSFLAGASMLRVDAFRAAGGFSPRLWLGGEEELLALDLVRAGWWLCYAEHVVVHHRASTARDSVRRRRLGIRNTLWTCWLRRRPAGAARWTAHLLSSAGRDRVALAGFADAARGLPWVLRERRPVPPEVEAVLRTLDEARRTSGARRYDAGPVAAGRRPEAGR